MNKGTLIRACIEDDDDHKDNHDDDTTKPTTKTTRGASTKARETQKQIIFTITLLRITIINPELLDLGS